MSTNTGSGESPIASTLGADDSRDRFAWIAALNRDALRSYEQRGLVLELCYALHAIDRVRAVERHGRRLLVGTEAAPRREVRGGDRFPAVGEALAPVDQLPVLDFNGIT